MLQRKAKIEKKIEEIEKLIAGMPEGKLNCSSNGKYYKWYHSNGKNNIYIPKKNRKLAEQLAAKKYLTLLKEDLLQEKEAIKAYLRKSQLGLNQAEQLLVESSEYQKLLSPYFKTNSQEFLEWQKSPYEQNKKFPENLIIKTSSGHYVRSKSEALIDMALYKRQIPFRYECALQLGKIIIYPDFTIRHPITGEVYYWEHFGRMDDREYAQKAFKKIENYNTHGILPSIRLIMTFETQENPLNSEVIENIIEQYFG
ncbi:MAG: ATPase [Roseburia sp.]|nr:ATPase [Roseburia sp.]